MHNLMSLIQRESSNGSISNVSEICRALVDECLECLAGVCIEFRYAGCVGERA